MNQYESQESINEIISKNLKILRKQKKLSLDSVSELTGVSKSMLGQIERGESSPTISTLWKIATGLHISFNSLMEKPEEEATVIRNLDINPLLSESAGFKLYPVFPLADGRSFEILYIEIEPGVSSNSLPHEPGTEEFVIVYSGELEITLEYENTYSVSSGCSIHYKADQNHEYRNPSSETAKLCMVINYRPS